MRYLLLQDFKIQDALSNDCWGLLHLEYLLFVSEIVEIFNMAVQKLLSNIEYKFTSLQMENEMSI